MDDNKDFFFVHVIESPGNRDLLDGRTQGRALIETLALSNIRTCYNLVTDFDSLLASLGERLASAMQYHGARHPILHFNLHGNSEGIALTNKVHIQWHQLRTLLLPINDALQGYLVVCMSSCFGATGCRMAMYENEPVPFSALVGHWEDATWGDATIAFASFYHLLHKGSHIADAMAGMKAASGDTRFDVRYGEAVRDEYLAYIRQHRIEQFQRALALLRPKGVALNQTI